MRVSTSQIFDAGTRNLIDGQSALYKTQNQLSTGRRVLTPDDDPVAAAQVLLTSQARDVNAMYADNQKNASSQLALAEDRLKSVVDSIQFIQEEVVAGGNASYSDAQRMYIAKSLQGQFDLLFGVANSLDASGHYLFSGYQGETQPFQQQNVAGTINVNYVGDDGQRLLQVSGSRQIAVNDSGRDIFLRNSAGNGSFVTGAAAANTGTGIVDPGSVVTPQNWTGHNYTLTFTSATTFDVTDTTTSTTVATGVSYTSNTAITSVPGVAFTIQGAPAAGDTFSVQPSNERSLFNTLQDLITAFSTPIQGNAVAGAAVRNTINANMANLDQALTNVSRVQASIGSRMAEMQSLSGVAADQEVQYAKQISGLQDIDYAEAISRFMTQQMQLQAAQQSFSKVSGMSLFNYL